MNKAFRFSAVYAAVIVAFFLFALTGFLYSGLTYAEMPANLAKFKDALNKGLTVSISGLDKNYARFLSVEEGNIPLKVSAFKSAPDAGKQFFKEYGKYFGVKNFAKELSFVRSEGDELGMTHLTYEQRLNNVPVYGGQIIAHLNGDLTVNSAGGKFVPGLSISVKPKLTAARALAQAKNIARQQFGFNQVMASGAKLYVFNQSLFDPRVKSKNYLVWRVLARDSFNRRILFLDAKTGALVQSLDDVQTLYRRIYNCNGADSDCTLYGSAVAAENGRYEGQAAVGVGDIDDLYDLAGEIHEFFQDNYGLNGANGLGGIGAGFGQAPITSTHAYARYVYPATVTTTCPNSFWDGTEIVFCATTVNAPVVGHEYTHGVVEFQGPAPKLAYINESGAINEALADIFGQALNNKVNGGRNWQIGPTGGLWRDLTDPEKQLDPATHYSDNFYCGDRDNGGVHRNSTVISHAAYLLATGGELNGCQIPRILPAQTERVFYRALDKYLTTHSDFTDFYDAANKACHDLYRSYSSVCAAIKTALQAAELDQPGKCSGVAKSRPACRPLAVDHPGIERALDETPEVNIPTAPSVDLNSNVLDNLTAPNPNVNLNQNLPDSSQTLSTSTDIVTPPVVSEKTIIPVPAVIEEEVRTPSFSVTVDQNGKNVTITGVLNYYGKGARCSGPRYFDPIIVRWGQGDSQPALVGNTFTASHAYDVKNKSYDLSVSVINSCFGSDTFHQTLTF